jgi:hypothetical protein
MNEEAASDLVQIADRVAESRVHRARDDFILGINEDNILRLASSYHAGSVCSFFRPRTRGSYNICYFVRFISTDATTEEWVVRVPLAPCLAFGADSKLQSEVATMEYGPSSSVDSTLAICR